MTRNYCYRVHPLKLMVGGIIIKEKTAFFNGSCRDRWMPVKTLCKQSSLAPVHREMLAFLLLPLTQHKEQWLFCCSVRATPPVSQPATWWGGTITGGVWDLPGPERVGTCSPWGSSWSGRLSSAWILSVQTRQSAQLLPRGATRGSFISVSKWLEKGVTQAPPDCPWPFVGASQSWGPRHCLCQLGQVGDADGQSECSGPTAGQEEDLFQPWPMVLEAASVRNRDSPALHTSMSLQQPAMLFLYEFCKIPLPYLNPPEKCDCLLGLPESVTFTGLLLSLIFN